MITLVKNGEIQFVDGTDQLIAQLSKADSEYDIIIAPINIGAQLIAKNQTSYRLKSILTWGKSLPCWNITGCFE